jgi:SAM-dependent methyltransferase
MSFPFARGLVEAVRVRWQLRHAAAVHDPFDETYGVRTRVVSTLAELWRTTWRGGFEHEPSPALRTREILDALDVDFKATVFVDYGSGAGRAVMLAAEYPFKEVIGIELAPSLHAQATANLLALPRDARRAGAVRLVCGDATTQELPPEPLVLYFYNPFGVAAMRRLLERLEGSLTERPRRVTMVLAHCFKKPREVLEESPFFEVSLRDRGITLLRSVIPWEGSDRRRIA